MIDTILKAAIIDWMSEHMTGDRTQSESEFEKATMYVDVNPVIKTDVVVTMVFRMGRVISFYFLDNILKKIK